MGSSFVSFDTPAILLDKEGLTVLCCMTTMATVVCLGLSAECDYMVMTSHLLHTGTPAEEKLAQLASGCAAVVVCRASPSQKAAIVRRMKRFRIEQCEVRLLVATASDLSFCLGVARAPITSALALSQPQGCLIRSIHPMKAQILLRHFAAHFRHLAATLSFVLQADLAHEDFAVGRIIHVP